MSVGRKKKHRKPGEYRKQGRKVKKHIEADVYKCRECGFWHLTSKKGK
jgi:rubrerythrin